MKPLRYVSDHIRRAIVEFYGETCQYCLAKPANHVDHIVPLSLGGSNGITNLILACERCNLSKHASRLGPKEERRYLELADVNSSEINDIIRRDRGQPERRRKRIFQILNIPYGTGAASGKYVRSLDLRPGIRYWCASRTSSKEDFFGVQFTSRARNLNDKYRPALLSAGYIERDKQEDAKWTYHLIVPFGQDDSLNEEGLKEAYAKTRRIMQ